MPFIYLPVMSMVEYKLPVLIVGLKKVRCNPKNRSTCISCKAAHLMSADVSKDNTTSSVVSM